MSNIGGTYDIADQPTSNREFGHFFYRKPVPSPSGVRCKPSIKLKSREEPIAHNLIYRIPTVLKICTAMVQLCSVQTFETIGQQRRISLIIEFLRDFSVGQVLGEYPLLWRHNEPNGVSNHQPHVCLLNRLFWHRSKKTSKLRVTGLSAGNSPETGDIPVQMASNAENVSIWWHHHAIPRFLGRVSHRCAGAALFQSI